MSFELHPRLQAGTFELGRTRGCLVLLKNQALFPWILIVPEVDGVEDLHELSPEIYTAVMDVMREVSEFVMTHFKPEKLNVACIGNQVRQMHVHVVGRSQSDSAWPGTVWSYEGKQPYQPEEVAAIQAAAFCLF